MLYVVIFSALLLSLWNSGQFYMWYCSRYRRMWTLQRNCMKEITY